MKSAAQNDHELVSLPLLSKEAHPAISSDAPVQEEAPNRSITPEQHDSSPEGQNINRVIIHQVQRGDTLQGLELQYEVSKFQIMQANNLSSDDFFWKKELIIPNPSSLLLK